MSGAASPDAERQAPVRDRRWLVLAVDDEVGVRNLIQGVLEPKFRVILAANGPEALDQARDAKPHLILLDLKMPGMDGLSVLAKLKANPKTNVIPVVIVSAQGETDALMEGQRAGAVDYIIKPFDIEDLKMVVQRQFTIRGD